MSRSSAPLEGAVGVYPCHLAQKAPGYSFGIGKPLVSPMTLVLPCEVIHQTSISESRARVSVVSNVSKEEWSCCVYVCSGGWNTQ